MAQKYYKSSAKEGYWPKS